MTEVRHDGTPQNQQSPNSHQKEIVTTLTEEEYAALEALRAKEANRKPSSTRNKIFGGAAVLLATVTAVGIGVARVFGSNSETAVPPTIPSASGPVTPGMESSTIETSTPTPASTETAPATPAIEPVGNDAEAGQTYLEETDVEDLNALKLSSRQKAVNWGELLTLIDSNQAPLFTSTNPRDEDASLFNPKEGRELFEYISMAAASVDAEGKNAEMSVEDYLDGMSGQELLDSYVAAEAVAWGQLANPSDPSDDTLDISKAGKMINGIFYDPHSAAAAALLAEMEASGKAKYFNGDDRLSPDSTSKRILTHKFGTERVPYKAVNYSDENGEHFLIFTANKSAFEGNDVIDPTTSKGYTVIRPLVVAKGDGTVDLTGHLNSLK